MYEDPKDMFGEIDDVFAHLFTRLTRDFMKGELPGAGYPLFLQGEGTSSPLPFPQRDQSGVTSQPVVEIHRIGHEVKVITELPGTTMDTIELELRGSTLCIDADGSPPGYSTRADLPPVDPGSMKTSFKNGVLEVTFTILPDIT